MHDMNNEDGATAIYFVQVRTVRLSVIWSSFTSRDRTWPTAGKIITNVPTITYI